MAKGVDAGDVPQREAILDRMFGVLPEAHDFGTKEVTAIDELGADIGGKKLREHHQHRLNSPKTR